MNSPGWAKAGLGTDTLGFWASQVALAVKNLTGNADVRAAGSISGLERVPG